MKKESDEVVVNIAQDHCCDTGDHSHDHQPVMPTPVLKESQGWFSGNLQLFTPSIVSFILLAVGMVFEHGLEANWFAGPVRIIWYVAAYLPVGLPVVRKAVENLFGGAVFSEFFLMSIATFGAFAIGEYPEAVGVMLFYSVGELMQGLAVSRARKNISALIDQRPEEVTVLLDGKVQTKSAATVNIGETLRLKPGEKLGLDGTLISESSFFNTAALTGESRPEAKRKGDQVLAGMVNLNTVSEVKVTSVFKDSALSRILELTQSAIRQKAPSELFIRKFAKVYTPIVVALAAAVCLLPALFLPDYQFSTWLYRALIFLVISCPCALVISIPLGYFGGIGAASRNGILVKGGNYLDRLAEIGQLVMDKTGTLTKGVFKVEELVWNQGVNGKELLELVNALESHSSHPVASAIHDYAGQVNPDLELNDIEEIPGKGLKGTYKGKVILAGNIKLMDSFGVHFDGTLDDEASTLVAVAFDGKYSGYFRIADEIKEDSYNAIQQLHALNINTIMLSGDAPGVVRFVADELRIDTAFGHLLPDDKVRIVSEMKDRGELVAFVGDGFNDAPVIALSDVGIAMGGLGSDAAIEIADVVIQDDNPKRIPMAVRIGRTTKNVVWQNVFLAFAVKILVLVLGVMGIATMWAAVFADVGVAMLAILNATRILKTRF